MAFSLSLVLRADVFTYNTTTFTGEKATTVLEA